ncbi:MAG: hypothetical protein LUH18_04135 [Oscillospiraceae bacterium]|nr:hypothetical protein [Oscillospiraceae bacterium]
MTAPHTYAEWSAILDKFKDRIDDDETVEAMQKGTIEWQTGVAERFTKKLADTVNYRMNSATDRFQRDISRSHGQEGAIVQALLSIRKELRLLLNAVSLPAIPEDYRKRYRQLIIDHANEIQSNLENSARSDRTGKLSSVIRNNRVNAL